MTTPAADRSARFRLSPYLRLQTRSGRLWLQDARRSTRIPGDPGLLQVLEVFSRPTGRAELDGRFDVSDLDFQALLDAGLIVPAPPPDAPSPAPARLALVSTMLRPGASLRSFIEYHLAVGVRRLYLFFEDPDDPALAVAARYPEVQATVSDDHLRARQRLGPLWGRLEPHLATEVMARQSLNAQTALEQAAADGVDWLVHLDADELLWSAGELAARLADVPPEVGQLLCLNHEAVPESFDVTDPFREVTLFRRPVPLCDSGPLEDWLREQARASWFIGYTDGKPAVRVAPGVLASWVHAFDLGPAHPLSVTSLDPLVLHYPRCGFHQYRERYRRQARPGAFCFGDPASPRISFDLRAAAAFEDADGGEARARHLYQQEVMAGGAEQVLRLVREGLCVRQPGPARILAGAAAGP